MYWKDFLCYLNSIQKILFLLTVFLNTIIVAEIPFDFKENLLICKVN